MRFVTLSLMMTLALAVSGADDKDKRPKISVKVNPAMGTNPVRVVASADLDGGANDYEEFYCPWIQFRLKRNNKVITSASTSVKVRPGIYDGGGLP
jgi:hypothetical protein